MNILILGGTGMLGSAVVAHFKTMANTEIFWTTRNSEMRERSYDQDPTCLFFDALCEPWEGSLWALLEDVRPDYIINCVGIIKPHMKDNVAQAIAVNASFPHQLAFTCKDKGIKPIHITTDCVFSGYEGYYTEDSPHDALDAYGKSKSLGECTKDMMVLRTSIIGPEPNHQVSLVEWIRAQEGKTIQGFTNHLWNGITTKQYAQICETIIFGNLWKPGLFHVHSPDTLSKFELVSAIAKKYGITCTINPTEANEDINRALATKETEFLQKLAIPSIYKQIQQM